MATGEKTSGILVEYLQNGRLCAGALIREQGDQVIIMEAGGKEHRIARELVLVRHDDRRVTRDNLRDALVSLQAEHERLAADLDLNLLWEIAREDVGGRTAREWAATFYGHTSSVEVAVMLEALLNDRLYFVRRHMEFVPREPEQVERLRTQYERIQLRSEGGRNTRRLVTAILEGGPIPAREEVEPLIADLTKFLENPYARSRETSALLEAVAGEFTPGEVAYMVLERLGAPPPGPRYALIGGLRMQFNETVQREAREAKPPSRPAGNSGWTVTIDDDETVEIDDALSCERMPDGNLRLRVHIALVADFVGKGTALDNEAGTRGTTVYLPETTVRMLPDSISTDAASLLTNTPRRVLTTEVHLSNTGELLNYTIYPEIIRISARLSYDQADQLLEQSDGMHDAAALATLNLLREAADRLRERRREAGARIIHRRESKVTVRGDEIEIRMIESSSPSRELVAECMILSNHVAARTAFERGVPMIYRVQPNLADDGLLQRARLSLHPEFHAGVGLDCYVQASSPIRRYVDLVLQRQLVSMLTPGAAPAYDSDEMLVALAAAETTEAEARELERRAKRYWTLTFLDRAMHEHPLEAIVGRDGASAELEQFAVRGALRGAPNLASNTPISVRVARVDPARGLLALQYLKTSTVAQGHAA